jgi:threonine dehydrogenase-like Zn-dependent dehydrogenase
MAKLMRAVAIRPGEATSAHPTETPRPEAQAGEYLVRILEVGIDGTDRELDSGVYGEAPPGEDRLVIGHESLGVVEDEAPGVRYCREGELVVPTVRRPCPERCPNCRGGEYDFCTTGNYRERGIKGLHGYLSEYVAVHSDFVVKVPDELRDVAVVVEPLSIVEKVYRQVELIQRRMMVWEPRRVIITGAGSVGVLAAFLARLRGLDTLVYSRGPATGAPGEILRRIGAEHADSSEQTLAEATERFGAPDIAVEATGYSPLAWDVAGVLARNGVACLLSVTGGERKAEIPSDQLNNHLVLGNRLVFGSVNAHRRDFEQGITDLGRIREQWPGVLERFITRRLPMERIREALDQEDEGGLKTVLVVASGGVHA